MDWHQGSFQYKNSNSAHMCSRWIMDQVQTLEKIRNIYWNYLIFIGINIDMLEYWQPKNIGFWSSRNTLKNSVKIGYVAVKTVLKKTGKNYYILLHNVQVNIIPCSNYGRHLTAPFDMLLAIFLRFCVFRYKYVTQWQVSLFVAYVTLMRPSTAKQ